MRSPKDLLEEPMNKAPWEERFREMMNAWLRGHSSPHMEKNYVEFDDLTAFIRATVLEAIESVKVEKKDLNKIFDEDRQVLGIAYGWCLAVNELEAQKDIVRKRFV